MENIQKKVHIISSSSFVLILLFCLLPFVSVQCSGKKIVQATGVELLTGNYSLPDDVKGKEKEKANPFMALVVLSILAGIICSIAFRNEERAYKISVICPAAIIPISLLLMQLYISSNIKSQSGANSMITVNYEIGYWLCLLLPLALIAFVLFLKETKKNLETVS
jgi:hypothetical protein